MTEIKTNGILESYDISEVGITDGLVAWYPLDGNTRDYTEYRNDGTNYGATISSGLEQTCYSFDGVDDQINLLSVNPISPNQGTVSAWFYMRGAQIDHATLFACQDGPAWANMRVNLGADGTSAIRFAVGNGTSSITNSCSSGTVTQNVWHHALGTYDGTNIKIYIDSILKNTVTSAIVPGTFIPNYTGIGFMNYSTRYWNGLIQDVRIYNRALSPEEIKILYELRKNKKTHFTHDNKVFIPGKFNEVY